MRPCGVLGADVAQIVNSNHGATRRSPVPSSVVHVRRNLPRTWMVRATAIWTLALGTVAATGAVAHDATEGTPLRVAGATSGDAAAQSDEAPQPAAGSTQAAPTAPAPEPDGSTAEHPPAPPDELPAPPPATTAAGPSTAAPAPAPPSSTTPTTPRPVPQATNTAPAPVTTTATTTASYHLRNNTGTAVTMVINDATHRLLPGQSIGPFATLPRGTDSASVNLEAHPECSDTKSGALFHRGATYDILIFESTTPCAALPTTNAPSFTIGSRLPVNG